MNSVNEQDRLDARIREHYEHMPPSERRLADLLLTFPGDIMDYSATELCELAKTSKAAATRFFSRLGYKDFNEARRKSREAKKWGAPLFQSNASAKQKITSKSQLIANHITREQTNLQRSLEGIEGTVLRSLVTAIATKKRIMVVGYRNNRFLAEYFQRQLSLLRENVTLHPSANQSIAEELFDIDSDDLLIVIGMRRRTQILNDIIQLASRHNTDVALISDPTAAALEKQVKWKINCIVYSTSTFDSYSSVMSVFTLLINCVLSESPSALDRLRKIESVHEQLGELNEKG